MLLVCGKWLSDGTAQFVDCGHLVISPFIYNYFLFRFWIYFFTFFGFNFISFNISFAIYNIFFDLIIFYFGFIFILWCKQLQVAVH